MLHIPKLIFMKNVQRGLTTILLGLFLLCPVLIFARTENRSFRIINAANGLADNSAQTIDCTFSGRMVVTSLGAINIYDGGYFSQIPDEDINPFYLSKYTGNYHLYFDNMHHMWLKDKHKVKCVDMMTERYISDLSPLFREHGITGNVEDLFVDTSGRLWIVSGDYLYAEKKHYQVRLRHGFQLQDLDVNGNMLMLFYNDGRMDSFNMVKGTHRSSSYCYDAECQKEYSNSTVLRRTENGFFQIRNGKNKSILLKYEFKSGKWTELMRQEYSLNNMEVKDSMLYIASAYGYWTYNMKTAQLDHYDEIMLNDGRVLLTDINTLCFDRHGGLWIGTERRGLLYSKPRISPFYVYTWENPRALELSSMLDKYQEENGTYPYESGVNCRYTDSRGWKWKGGRNGVTYTLPGTQKEIALNDSIGLLNHVAHCIIEDGNHNIWLGTSCGIAVLLIKDDKITHAVSFDSNDNVPIESFTDGRTMLLPNGNIMMQSIDHVIEFRPSTFITEHDNFVPLHPKLIRLMVNGNVVGAGTEVDGRVIIEKAVSRVRHIDFDYLATNLKLTFSAMNYFRPLQTYYRVRVLGGTDENWRVLSYFNSNGLVDSKGLLHLPLVGLEPGEYTVEVQASMFPDIWDTPSQKYTLSILQPWWQTTGLYITLLIVVGCMIAYNVKNYKLNNRLRMKCNLGEFELSKLLGNFLKRCEVCSDDILMPSRDELSGDGKVKMSLMSKEFVSLVLDLKPHVDDESITHDVLKNVGSRHGMDILELYDLVANNVNKNPRLFVRAVRLIQAEKLVVGSGEDMDAIASECHFVNTDYFVKCFTSYYGYTPIEYRYAFSRDE